MDYLNLRTIWLQEKKSIEEKEEKKIEIKKSYILYHGEQETTVNTH